MNDFSEEQYENYAAKYRNVIEELKKPDDDTPEIDLMLDDYELITYNKLRIDFEHILELLRGVMESLGLSEDNFEEKK